MPRQTKTQEIDVLTRRNISLDSTLQAVQERLAALEIEQENLGYERLTTDGKWDFQPEFLRWLISRARLMAMKNPLIKRAVSVQTFYVWALGWSVDAENEDVLKCVRGYLKDPRNKPLWSQKSLFDMEAVRQTTGNMFLVHFTNKETGQVRTRKVDVEEIVDVIYNPSDRTEPWFYIRSMNGLPNYSGRPPAGGGFNSRIVIYPDINYNPVDRTIPDSILKQFPGKNYEVQWNNPMSGYKTGGFESMKFGVPEIYAALDWALAYKAFLEDWATLMRAYARIAMQMSGNKKSDIPGAKSKLEVERAGNVANNTAPGGFMVSSGGIELKAVKTAGSTTSAEEGYSIKLMVAAAVDIPGTFFGDADVGNFATSQTLDRPTELKMVARQGLWKSDLGGVFGYVVLQSALAPQGKLNKLGFKVIPVDDADGLRYYTVVAPDVKDLDEDIRETIRIDFPDILERNVTERVRGVIGALTLNGNLPTDVLPDRKFMAKMLLESMGLDPQEVRAELIAMFPAGKAIPPILPPPAPGAGMGGDIPPSASKGTANKGRKGPAGGTK